MTPSRIENNKKFLSQIKSLSPDLIVVVGYNKLIPREIFEIPKYKSINMHPSYLPYYRGQHVINWALINGEKETGVTIHVLNEKFDKGPIIKQKKIPIYLDEDIVSLSKRISKAGGKLLVEVIDNLKQKNFRTVKQSHIRAKYYRPRKPEDGKIDWNNSSKKIYNLVRALVDPYPNAFTYINNKKIYIKSCKFFNNKIKKKPGLIISVDKLRVACKRGIIEITDYSPKNVKFNVGDNFV